MFQTDALSVRISTAIAQAMAQLVADASQHQHFWQQDWKKHRRRGWKRKRSAGLHR